MPLFSNLAENEILILKELLKNSRVTDVEICKNTGLSRSTVAKTRINLERKNIIDAYVSYPNIGQAIFVFTAYRWTNFSNEEEKKAFESYVESRSDVATYLKGAGCRGATHVIVSIHATLAEYECMMNDIREKMKQNGEVVDAFLSSKQMQIKSFKSYLQQII